MESKDIKSTIKLAIDECIEEDILKEFFLDRREEIEDMMELDYSFEKQLYFAEKEGREVGIEEGKKETLLSLMKDGTITSAVAAQKLGVSEEEVIFGGMAMDHFGHFLVERQKAVRRPAC